MTKLLAIAGCLWIVVCGFTFPASAQDATPAPVYASDGKLIRPLDYRSWAFVTSGLGMTYGPAQPASGRPPMFDNVFVTPDAYKEFLRSGTWPDRTMFVLEIRRAEANVSINNGGYTQGEVARIEASVKDQRRFRETGGWGYFSFDSPEGLIAAAAPLPASASCYGCHGNNTAVDNTFVQFYAELFTVAQRMGTIKPTYDPTRKP